MYLHAALSPFGGPTELVPPRLEPAWSGEGTGGLWVPAPPQNRCLIDFWSSLGSLAHLPAPNVAGPAANVVGPAPNVAGPAPNAAGPAPNPPKRLPARLPNRSEIGEKRGLKKGSEAI